MTHTLHRVGDYENLKDDYVFLMMPSQDINHENSAPKLKRFFEMALEKGAIKIGDCRSGNEYYQGGVEEVVNNVEDRAVIHAVFTDRDKVIDMLEALKEEDLGLSVVLTGIVDQVNDCLKEVNIQRHTVEHSLGRWGDKEKLPPKEILEIATMCGHAMVSVNLIRKMIKDIKDERITSREAAEELFKPCMCGIFNVNRAEKLLDNIVS